MAQIEPRYPSINKIDSKQSNKGQESIFDDDLSQCTIPQGDSLDSGFSADIFEESNTAQDASPTNAENAEYVKKLKNMISTSGFSKRDRVLKDPEIKKNKAKRQRKI